MVEDQHLREAIDDINEQARRDHRQFTGPAVALETPVDGEWTLRKVMFPPARWTPTLSEARDHVLRTRD